MDLNAQSLHSLPNGSVVRHWWGSGDYDVSIVLYLIDGRWATFGQAGDDVRLALRSQPHHLELLSSGRPVSQGPAPDAVRVTPEQALALPQGSVVEEWSRLGEQWLCVLPWHRGRDGWQLPDADGHHTPFATPGATLVLLAHGTPADGHAA